MSDETPRNSSESAASTPADDVSSAEDAAATGTSSADALPDDLPEVKPPSAAFIVQLFLVPGLIVLVVVGVWALFGKMAASEQNWIRLVEELKQKNTHRRWRAALGLAQTLKADQERGGKLASNPQLAEALAEALRTELKAHSKDADDLKLQIYLVRALRLIDVPQIVLPVLQLAIKPDSDADERLDVRKNAITSIAEIAGRAADRDKTAGNKTAPGPRLRMLCEFPSLLDDLIAASGDDDPLIRQCSAFTLGMFPVRKAREQLIILLENNDEKTQINAAIALARQREKVSKGLAVFEKQFRSAAEKTKAGDGVPAEDRSATRYFWLGISAVTLLLTAVWAFGTTQKKTRMIAAVCFTMTLVYLSWGIYDLVRHSSSATPAEADREDDSVAGKTLEERRRNAHAARFERLVILRNSLKAVGDLESKLTPQETSRIVALIEPIAEKHSEPRIRLEAGKTIRLLQGDD
ncbi:MAG: hypothetical protein IID45_06830 [Planctomycetes bacterium]|nr:hypothetical protein [Planctomycetota bacterium]